MATIRLENVAKTYDNGQVAVRDFDLQIDDGEFLVLVGPSGCGKSTTLRMIAGLEEVTSGDVFIEDVRVNDVPPAKRDIAMVFQNYALYPHMTVRQNMSFGLKMRKASRSEIKQRVDEVAEVLSITSLLDRRPKALSGGQRQRVALGRAIVRQPAAFLFDEPLSNLDAKLRIQMRKELAQLHQRLQTTTVYVTHDQVEAMTLGDRIVIMNEGEIQQVAAPLEIYERPANQFVASFVGSPAMNLVPGNCSKNEFNQASFVAQGLKEHEGYTLSHLEDCDTIPADVTLGFRPEHLSLDRRHPKLAEVTVDVVERMGNETLLYFSWNNQHCTARLNGQSSVQPGAVISLHLPKDRWHLFACHEGKERLFSSGEIPLPRTT